MNTVYLKNMLLAIIVLFLGVSCTKDTGNAQKDATDTTKEYNQAFIDYLPFEENTNDFYNANKGFIGNSSDNISFDFIKNQNSPDTVNPSLWRQSQLNNISGLFEVTPDIYQVRGFDLANITFIRSQNGWIVVDPLTTGEAAKKAKELFRKHKGDAPITGVIFTHSHTDHFGGIKGILSDDEIASGIPIVAPENFFEEAISENILAGNAMARRSSYMYGSLLPKDEKGTVDAGLGKGLSTGIPSIAKPTKSISKTGEKYTIDGLEFEFLMAQNTEAPAEFMFYIDKYNASSSAEVINHTMHNLSTLRGAKTRNSILWADAIANSKHFLANRTDVLFGSHHWPTWEQENIDNLLTKHGDLYKFIHDQTLRMANQGYTPLEIAEQIIIPDSLAKEFYNRDYYGTVNHNVKAVYDFYFGAWWDGNPANLYKLPPVDVAKKYVEFMGGENKVIRMAEKSFNDGEYRWVAEVMNHVIFENPNNQKAKNLSADAMEQLGYQAESAVWRAYLLTGASELRNGIPDLPAIQTASPDMLKELPIKDFLGYLAVKLNPEKSKNINLSMNLMISDERYAVNVQNSVLKFTEGTNKNADLSVSMSRNTFNQLLLKQIELEDVLGTDVVISNIDQFTEFMLMFDEFEFWFNIVTP